MPSVSRIHQPLGKTTSTPHPPPSVPTAAVGGREESGRGRSLPRNVEAPPAAGAAAGWGVNSSPLLKQAHMNSAAAASFVAKEEVCMFCFYF